MTRSERRVSTDHFCSAAVFEGVDWGTDDGKELANMLLVLEPINSSPIPAQSYVSRTKGRIPNYDRLTKKQKAMRLRDEAIKDLRVAGMWPAFWMIAKWAFISLAKRVLLNWLLSQIESESDSVQVTVTGE